MVTTTAPDWRSYDAAFAAWLTAQAAQLCRAKPHLPPWPVDRFDGCTLVPDLCRWACGLHDCRYWLVESPSDRLDADRRFRDDIASTGLAEDRLAGFWTGIAWLAFAGVRACGWLFAGAGSRLPRVRALDLRH